MALGAFKYDLSPKFGTRVHLPQLAGDRGDEGHYAGARSRRSAGVFCPGSGPRPVPARQLQLGEPEEVHSPADLHGCLQLLPGDKTGWHRAQSYQQDII